MEDKDVNENVNEEEVIDEEIDTEIDDDETQEEDNQEEESSDEDEEDKGNVHTLSEEEYNELMMNKRLLEKLSKEEKKESKQEPTKPQDIIKEKYPGMDDDSLNVIMDIVKTVADTQFKDVVEQTTDQKIRSDINDYALKNGLDSEATQILTNVALKPQVKELLKNNILDVEQLEILSYGKKWKEELAKTKVANENKSRKSDVHTETKSKGATKKSSNKSVKDMTWDEYDEYAKTIGLTYEN